MVETLTNGHRRLIDRHGTPLQLASTNGTKPKTGEEGFSAEEATLFSGPFWRNVDPTPRDISRMLADDPQAQALRLGVVYPLRQAVPRIDAAQGGDKEAQWLRQSLLSPEEEGGMSTPMESVIAGMADAVFYGVAFFEKVWEIENGQYVLKRLALRPAATCSIERDENGNILGFTQRGIKNGMPWEAQFGPEKAFVYVFGHYTGHSEGETLFKPVWHFSEHKKKVLWLTFTHLRLFALGMKVGTYGGEGGKAGADAFHKRIVKVEGGGSMLKGPKDSVDLLSITGASAEFREIYNMLTIDQARAINAQWQLLGTVGQTGSWALSRDHSDFYLMGLQAIQRDMAAALNADPLKQMQTMNFINPKYARLTFDELSETAIERAMQVMQQLIANPQAPVNPGLRQLAQELVLQGMGGDPEKLVDEAPAPGDPNAVPAWLPSGYYTGAAREVVAGDPATPGSTSGVTPQGQGQGVSPNDALKAAHAALARITGQPAKQ